MRAVDTLCRLSIAAGLGWSLVFIAAGLGFRLELYGDGAMFSYAVAVQDVWALHWHNISQRSAVYLLTMAPAELFVTLTGSAASGIAVYGLLFFSLPLAGLVATYFADRSPRRIVFVYACASTAVLCPLVFGFPTEMWLAHALFWPALALAREPRGPGGTVLVFVVLLALVFAHEGGIVLAAVILALLVLRGWRDAALRRAGRCLLAAAVLWLAVKFLLPPGNYFAEVYTRAATQFFDIDLLMTHVVGVLAGTLAVYGVLVVVLSRIVPERAHLGAAAITAAALATYWWQFDHSVHADHRYYMRTALVLLTPVFGVLADMATLRAEGRPLPRIPVLAEAVAALGSTVAMRVATGALGLIVLVHAVETVQFVAAWTRYRAAVRVLATGAQSDPSLGDPRFVSSARIGADLNRLSWFSTTPYLSAIVADFAPSRLAIDPNGNYFWMTCATATANAKAVRVVPVETRDLIRIYSCLHR